MGAKSQIELILELKNRMAGGLRKAKAGVGDTVQKMKQKIKEGTGDFKASFTKSFDGVIPSIKNVRTKNAALFSSLKDQIPFLGRFSGLLSNPFVLATAAVVALVGVLVKATAAAARFSFEFFEIRQLNLGKPREELDKYRDQILELSFETGVAQNKMSKGFFDVQSATGLFGDDVAKLSRQVADYSKVTKADFNSSINSTVKAMKAFGFGVDGVTDFLISNAKTVQVGITTFDELARVQTEFAGAAAGANQTVNTANKIFAAFTAIAKDSTIAATLTKSALEGLTQDRTVKGLRSIGVNMFDANGQMRSIDKVIRELTPKLQGMSDIRFLKLRNAIGGPEGLQNLLNTLKSSGGDVLKTFETFDKSEFSMAKAMANANNEAQILKEELSNKVSVIMTEIGNKLLPVWTATLKAANWLIDRIRDGASFLWRIWLLNVKAVQGLVKGIRFVFSVLGKGINFVFNMLGGEGNIWDRIFGTLDRWWFKIRVFFEDIATFGAKSFELLEAGLSGDLVKAAKLLKELRGFSFRDADALFREHQSQKGKDPAATDAAGSTSASALPTDLEGGVASSQQVRNLSINIEAFNKDGIHVVKEGDINSMSEDDMEQWFNRMMMRLIRNVETTVQ